MKNYILPLAVTFMIILLFGWFAYAANTAKTSVSVPLTLDNAQTTIKSYQDIIKAQNEEIKALKEDLHLCWDQKTMSCEEFVDQMDTKCLSIMLYKLSDGQ